MTAKQRLITLLAVIGSLAAPPLVIAQEPQPLPDPPPAQAAARSYVTNLSYSGDIQAAVPFRADIRIQDTQGGEVTAFDLVHEKPLHLIVISADYTSFQHLFPEHLGTGHFKSDILLPAPGTYALICLFHPTGEKEHLSIIEIRTAGAPAPAAVADIPISEATELFLDDIKITLTTSPQPIRAGQETVLSFGLNQAENLRPIEEAEPYLGEKGYLVVVRKSWPLTAKDYLRVQAVKEGEASVTPFHVRFPEPGQYKLWFQFNVNNVVQTADFWITAE